LCKGWRGNFFFEKCKSTHENIVIKEKDMEKVLETSCEDCEHSVPAGSAVQPTLICRHKAGAELPWQVVEADGLCANFEQSREIVPLDIAGALAEGAKLIPLSQGKFAIVDAEDYEELSKYKWRISKSRRTDYAVRGSGGRHVKMHRMLLNAPAGLMVDHRDLNGLNNRKSNLRLCTNKENVRHSRPSLGKTSRYKGVYRDKREKKFIARIVVDRKKYCLGYFDDEIEAAIAYDIKAMVFFGEFAYLNFPQLMRRYRIQMTEDR